MKQIIDSVMVPAFRSDAYGRGLLAGTRAVAEAVTTPIGGRPMTSRSNGSRSDLFER